MIYKEKLSQKNILYVYMICIKLFYIYGKKIIIYILFSYF